MNILVTGATGAVGPCVVQALCKAGHTVRTFSLDRPNDGCRMTDARRRTDRGNTGSNECGDVETLIGDVTDPLAVQSAMHGVDAAIHDA
ncbi:MAG: NmrA family NAD(P)-binding protein [Kiritimatiellae bacterium]|nr:NmrA family NAD(P)-binding protein [Kiritimatiellia bacterium]